MDRNNRHHSVYHLLFVHVVFGVFSTFSPPFLALFSFFFFFPYSPPSVCVTFFLLLSWHFHLGNRLVKQVPIALASTLLSAVCVVYVYIIYMYLYTLGYLFSVLFLQLKNREEMRRTNTLFCRIISQTLFLYKQLFLKTVETFFVIFLF
jgi:hypothetical protein